MRGSCFAHDGRELVDFREDRIVLASQGQPHHDVRDVEIAPHSAVPAVEHGMWPR